MIRQTQHYLDPNTPNTFIKIPIHFLNLNKILIMMTNIIKHYRTLSNRVGFKVLLGYFGLEETTFELTREENLIYVLNVAVL